MDTQAEAPDAGRFSRSLRSDETIVWTGHGGGSSDLLILLYFLFIGVVAAPLLAFIHFAVTPLSYESLFSAVAACVVASALASSLIRGRDASERDYVLTNQRLIIGNADPADATLIDIVCEADRRTIRKLRVQGRSDYSGIRIDLDLEGEQRTIMLLDQERSIEIADLIRRTLKLA